jgi:hypothetical protein
VFKTPRRAHDGVIPSLKEWIKICLNYTLKNVGLGLIIGVKIKIFLLKMF